MIAFDTTKSMPTHELHTKLKRIVDLTRKNILVDDANLVRLPSEHIELFIKDHKANGIPIDESIGNKIQSL